MNNCNFHRIIPVSKFNLLLISDSVENIGSWAFGQCTSLTSVRLPKDVKLGKDVFAGTKVNL